MVNFPSGYQQSWTPATVRLSPALAPANGCEPAGEPRPGYFPTDDGPRKLQAILASRRSRMRRSTGIPPNAAMVPGPGTEVTS